LSALCLAALSAEAATITVINSADGGPGSLRQALADANDGDTIDFSVSGTIALTSGELVVDKNMTISGPGATNLSVDGNASSRVLHINSDKTVTISGLTIANGAGDSGGGIYNEHAALTLSNCTVSGNSASHFGGGIFSYGSLRSATLTLNNSTISGNSASFGGGIDNYVATLTANNSTLSGNSASFGGGIENVAGYGSATLTLNNSTLSGNSATDGGGIYNAFATLNITDTILNARVSGENIYNDSGTVTSHGYNLSSDSGSGYLTATGDQINTDPQLGPLAFCFTCVTAL
jgi:hypothetical protein